MNSNTINPPQKIINNKVERKENTHILKVKEHKTTLIYGEPRTEHQRKSKFINLFCYSQITHTPPENGR